MAELKITAANFENEVLNSDKPVLLDFYGPVLTDKQRVILTEYYDEDLSLAEIAENLGITRQGVRDAIKHGEAAVVHFFRIRQCHFRFYQDDVVIVRG